MSKDTAEATFLSGMITFHHITMQHTSLIFIVLFVVTVCFFNLVVCVAVAWNLKYQSKNKGKFIIHAW